MIAKNKKLRKKTSKEAHFFQFLFSILALFFIVSLGFSTYKIADKRKELALRIESLEKEIENLTKEREQLEEGISQTEKEIYWEEKIREQGYVIEGENPVVVLPPEETEEQKEQLGQGFFEKIMESLKSLLASTVQQ